MNPGKSETIEIVDDDEDVVEIRPDHPDTRYEPSFRRPSLQLPPRSQSADRKRKREIERSNIQLAAVTAGGHERNRNGGDVQLATLERREESESGQRSRLHRAEQVSVKGSRMSDRASIAPVPGPETIDLDLLPDVRPTSPTRSTMFRAGYTDYGVFGNRSQDYGTASKPIDVDQHNNAGEGSSRLQRVNGSPVGTFVNGRYVPYQPYQRQSPLPYTIPEDRTTQQRADGPSNIYDSETARLRRDLTAAYARQERFEHPQGRFPVSHLGHDINHYSNQVFPRHPGSASADLSRYQEAYQQDQISAEDLQNLMANIKEREIPPDQRVSNPTGLTKSLMEHQRVGLTWLLTTEEGTNKGGILADAMGLGKTIQAISLMLSNPSKDLNRKTTLVVAPVALLRQWEREIRVMTCPTPSIYIHHGQKKLVDPSAITRFDVVLTSYNTVGYEEAALTRNQEQLQNGQTSSPGSPSCPLIDTNFYRVILDEAHFIKNKLTRSAKGCGMLKATYRWALTGTPMQNSVEELYSLISFLRIKPYNDHKIFTREIAKPLVQKNQEVVQKATKKLQALLTAIMLRRTKDSQIDGRAILHLPEKHNIVDEVTMGEDERERYAALESGARTTLQRVMNQDRSATGSNVLVLLLKLRQTCNHSLLSGSEEKDITVLSLAQGQELARTLRPEVVDRLKTASAEGFECPVCLDRVTSGITILVPCGHYYCGECLVQAMETRGQHNEEEGPSRCPQCRGPFEIQQCISLLHFTSVHGPPIVEKSPRDEVERELGNEDAKSSDSFGGSPMAQLEHKGKGVQKHANWAVNRTISDRFSSKYKMQLSEFAPSAKIQMILSLLLDIRSNRPGEKTIVFSQFTSFLDLVEIPLSEYGIRFLRYDGSLAPEQRNNALVKFEEDGAYNVILVSLKAGNVGLNLTCANHVILSEPFYNPYVEDQAIDRAHRIGQQREVFVHRLIIKESVESRVLAIQNRKRALIEGAMDASQSAAITKLGRKEIAFLFGLGTL